MQIIIERIKRILLTPTQEWLKINAEEWTIQDLFTKYVMILAAIPSVAGFIGHWLVGHSTFGATIRFGFAQALTWAVLQYIVSVGGVFLIATIMDLVAPKFELPKDQLTSMKIVVFSHTAYWVGGVLNLIPNLAALGALLGIYSVVLMYLGMKQLRTIPADKLTPYFVTVLVIALIVYVVLGFVIGAILSPSVNLPAAG